MEICGGPFYLYKHIKLEIIQLNFQKAENGIKWQSFKIKIHILGANPRYIYILWECDSVFDVIKSSRWLWSTGTLESHCSTFSRMLMVTCSLADLAHLVMHCHVLYNLPYPSCAKSRGRELEHSKLKPGCWARQANA